jgi:cystathionine beta-lyase
MIRPLVGRRLADDPKRLDQLFGRADLVPLWIAEPYVELDEHLRDAMIERASAGWYGYESRPGALIDAFWAWMDRRHGWTGSGLDTSVSPSVATSLSVLIDAHTDPGDGVILQPPVFTDFKPIVTSSGRTVVRNALRFDGSRYSMDLGDLAAKAADPRNRFLILCNPHNPVGRSWTSDELSAAARICADHDVFVLADEIHADLTLPPSVFTPFQRAGAGTGVRWAATHGPIKTFGLAGVCDTLMITDDVTTTESFRTASSRYHLTRNNVFSLAAFATVYAEGDLWLDRFLAMIDRNVDVVSTGLPDPLGLVTPEATYLAWLDLRELGLEVPDLNRWLVDAGLALSPGHWFGREGAGFARMTIAAPEATIDEAVTLLTEHVDRRGG